MDPADDVDGAAKASPLYATYGTRVDSQSARELLAARVAAATAAAEATAAPKAQTPAPAPAPKETAKTVGGGAEAIGDFLNSRQGKQMQKEVVRGIFGLLKKKF
jgi:hypothetical protein